MKRLSASILVGFVLLGTAAAETRTVGSFRAVDAEDRLQITIAAGDRHSVDVSGAAADRIRTRVEGRTLYIEDARRPLFGPSPRLDAQVRITVPAIESISAARGAEVAANLDGVVCQDLSASASMGGSATITGAQCNDVSSSAAMGGALSIAGVCRSHEVAAAMGGYVRASDIRCEIVDASASMGGDIRAFASQNYDASASMGGAIEITGGGRAIDTSAFMGGSIRAR